MPRLNATARCRPRSILVDRLPSSRRTADPLTRYPVAPVAHHQAVHLANGHYVRRLDSRRAAQRGADLRPRCAWPSRVDGRPPGCSEGDGTAGSTRTKVAGARDGDAAVADAAAFVRAGVHAGPTARSRLGGDVRGGAATGPCTGSAAACICGAASPEQVAAESGGESRRPRPTCPGPWRSRRLGSRAGWPHAWSRARSSAC